ncbi:MAG: hypothetical protein AAGH68_08920 [Pseudomonadota bacterium]
MDYIRPFDPATGLPSVDAAWTNGDPGTGTEGSIPPAEFYHAVLSELCHVIDYYLGDGSWQSGQNGADNTQIRQAIQAASAQFTMTLAVDGELQIPGGWIMKWGTLVSVAQNQTAHSIVFPTAFPNACFGVYPTLHGVVVGGSIAPLLISMDRFGAQVAGDHDTGTRTGDILWTAIGW